VEVVVVGETSGLPLEEMNASDEPSDVVDDAVEGFCGIGAAISLERELGMESFLAPDVAWSDDQLDAFFANEDTAMLLELPIIFDEPALICIMSYGEDWKRAPALGGGRTTRSAGGVGNDIEREEMLNAPEPSDIAGRRAETFAPYPYEDAGSCSYLG